MTGRKVTGEGKTEKHIKELVGKRILKIGPLGAIAEAMVMEVSPSMEHVRLRYPNQSQEDLYYEIWEMTDKLRVLEILETGEKKAVEVKTVKIKTKFKWNGKNQAFKCDGKTINDECFTKLCENCGGPLGSHLCNECGVPWSGHKLNAPDGEDTICWDRWREFYPLVDDKQDVEPNLK